jgi:hypothetical protein
MGCRAGMPAHAPGYLPRAYLCVSLTYFPLASCWTSTDPALPLRVTFVIRLRGSESRRVGVGAGARSCRKIAVASLLWRTFLGTRSESSDTNTVDGEQLFLGS